MLKRFKYLAVGFALGFLGLAGGAALAINITGSNTVNNRSFFEVGILRMAREPTITAFAGGGQTSAYQLTAGLSRIATVASGNDSVKLPVCTTGIVVVVTNQAASNSANVFPATGDAINALGANAAFALAANKTAVFFCGVDGTWAAILTA